MVRRPRANRKRDEVEEEWKGEEEEVKEKGGRLL